MKYLHQALIIIAVTFFSEILKVILPFPFPASIYGLILMLILLILKVIRLPQVKAVSDWLLSLMPVMFVGPTVALIVTFDEYKSFLLPLLIVATVTTVIVMAVSGCTAQALINRSERKEDRDAE